MAARTIALLLGIQAAACLLAGEPADAPPAPDAILATLERGHPRLLLRDDRLAELKRLATSDALLATCISQVCADADTLCRAKAIEHVLIGPRLLSVSRECLHRVLVLGLAWRLTGRTAYLDQARATLLTVCAFSDWNPSHFLDVAEMSNAVGIGYDWLYPALAPTERDTIRTALIRLGLEEGVQAVGGFDGTLKHAFWVDSAFNWNQVCHGGLTVASLAVAESDPRYAQVLIASACRHLPTAIASYDPDGAWPEGPGYWAYATDYTVYCLAGMESALKTTFGLDQHAGLSTTGLYPVCVSGPTGLMPNFADAGDFSRFSGTPLLSWLGQHYHQAGLCDAQDAYLAAGRKATPLDIIWYRPSSGSSITLPLDRSFGGAVELGVMRSAWKDPNALYAYIKAGYNQVNHGHLDLGSFECDCLGERWVRDLGSDDYNLPGYFSGGTKGPRWRYFRLNSHSHSVPLIDGQDQLVAGKAKLLRFISADAPRAVVDLSSAYVPSASRVQRGISLIESRSALLVQDELELTRPADITWAITTDAAVEVQGGSAILTLHGKHMRATILAPAHAQFSVESAEQTAPQKPNHGVRRLLIVLAGASDSVRIAVRLAPQPPMPPLPALTPLSAW